jgi:hypothetical protein
MSLLLRMSAVGEYGFAMMSAICFMFLLLEGLCDDEWICSRVC